MNVRQPLQPRTLEQLTYFRGALGSYGIRCTVVSLAGAPLYHLVGLKCVNFLGSSPRGYFNVSQIQPLRIAKLIGNPAVRTGKITLCLAIVTVRPRHLLHHLLSLDNLYRS